MRRTVNPLLNIGRIQAWACKRGILHADSKRFEFVLRAVAR